MSLISRFVGKMMDLPAPESRAIKVQRDLQVPMDDGVVLLADRYIPASGHGPLVLVRSPYGRKNLFGTLFGTLFAERGLQALVQSCRGTFGSEGELDAFAEREDGLATVAWMRKQDWYPGEFATAGPSYLGFAQWAIASEAGPELKAMAALVTSSDPYMSLFEGGSFSLQTCLTWINIMAHQERRFALIRQGRANRRLRPLYGDLPLGDLDTRATGRKVRDWQDWLACPSGDEPYWARRRFADGRARVGASVSLVGGWYDIFLPGQLRDYAALRAAGHEPFLLIGPWQHTDADGMGASVKESVAWLRARMLDDASETRTAPVRIYVGGLGEWRELPSWPPQARQERWHLRSGGELGPHAPVATGPDSYTYDPADPTPSVGGPVLSASPRRSQIPPDNRELEARPDVLTYTSVPLDRELEVIGQVSAELFVRSSLEHTDFFARLCDVDPAGRSTGVCDALRRLAPGSPAAGPDGTIRVRIDLWPTAHVFKAGHRVRLQVSSGAHPRYARNPGSGEPLGTATTLVSARQQVFHDPEHPSALILPVTAPDAATAAGAETAPDAATAAGAETTAVATTAADTGTAAGAETAEAP
ncbi:MAG TPA: CocE/NonD family hydrolase [Streptosporangiaceae bacterium]|nr:CocE/NonD family hydrolase [Streptosporangiaceae bacterium]